MGGHHAVGTGESTPDWAGAPGGGDGRPFSEQVTDARWRREAEAWIGRELERLGIVRAGPIEQPRVRPWSTQLVVPVDGGPVERGPVEGGPVEGGSGEGGPVEVGPVRGARVWFKANCSGQSFEPRLQAELARLLPHHVDEPLAVEPERAWMLTRDRGTTLAASHEPGPADWEAVLRQTAQMQRFLASRPGGLVSLGLPDCSPDTVAERLDGMTATLAGLPSTHPAHLPEEQAAAVRAIAPQVEAAAQVLATSPLPPSLQHGDLHPGNVFVVDSELHVFDFGDAQLAHPLESLPLPWALTHTNPGLPWPELLGAYHEPWSDLLSLPELEELLAAAVLTQPVNRSFTWWSSLSQASDQEWAEWGEAPVRHLTNVLRPWP